MPFIADLHTHSYYSRATSKASTLPGLAAWAAVKGINLVATGDFTHPGWFAHLNEHLEPAELVPFQADIRNYELMDDGYEKGLRNCVI